MKQNSTSLEITDVSRSPNFHYHVHTNF